MKSSLRPVIPLALLCLVLPSWLLPNRPITQHEFEALAPTSASGGTLENREGLIVLRLSGSPYERGYQHGTLLRREIRARIREEVYGGLVVEREISHMLLLRRARQIDTLLSEEHRQEMKGLADGAGLSYAEVLVLNTAEDPIGALWTASEVRQLLLSLSPQFVPHFVSPQAIDYSGTPARNAAEERAPALTLQGALAAFGSATRDGRLLQAAWFAPPGPDLDDLMVIVCRPDWGSSYVGLGKPGEVGVLAGVSEEGIMAMALASPSQDVSLVGVASPMLLREVLQYGGDLTTASRILARASRTSGQNILLGDGKRPDAQALEFSAHLLASFPAENDFIARTQHYLGTVLGQTQYSLSWWDGESSWKHLDSLLRAVERAYGDLDSETAGRLIRELGSVEVEASARDDRSVSGMVLDGRSLEIRLVTGGDGEASPSVSLDEAP